MEDSNTTIRRRSLIAAIGTGAVTGCLRGANDVSDSPAGPQGNSDTGTQPAGSSPTESQADSGESANNSVSLTTAWEQFYEPVGSPVLGEGVLYSGSRSGVQAFSTSNGELQWRSGDGYTPVEGVLDGDSLIYGLDLEPGLFRVSRDSGERLAAADIGPTGRTPAVTDNHVVIGTANDLGSDGTENRLVGFRKSDLTETWSITNTDVKYTHGLGYEGHAIVGFGGQTSRAIESRDAGTGELRWSVEGNLMAPPALLDGDLIALTLTGEGLEIRFIDPGTGVAGGRTVLTREDPSTSLFGRPLLSSGRIFIPAFGTVYAISPGEGVDWSVDTEARFNTKPAIYGDNLWVAPVATGDRRDRRLLAFDLASGEVEAEVQFPSTPTRPFDFGSQLGIQFSDRIGAYNVG